MCPPDETTFDYVTQRTSEPFEPVYADSAAQYVESFRFDVSKLEPTVAARMLERMAEPEVGGARVDQRHERSRGGPLQRRVYR